MAVDELYNTETPSVAMVRLLSARVQPSVWANSDVKNKIGTIPLYNNLVILLNSLVIYFFNIIDK